MDNPAKPDLKTAVPLASIPDGGQFLGVIDGEDALLVRRGAEVLAVGAHCTHYHGPLAEGLVVQDTVRCPWHHACFSLRTGEALALQFLARFPVGERNMSRTRYLFTRN